jgi:two-component system sensor histidine kinase RegB
MAAWQITRISAVHWLIHVPLPLAWVFIPPVIVIVSNIWLSTRVVTEDRPGIVSSASFIAGMFIIDVLCLTAALMLAGGPENPYSVLYIVEIALAAIVLPRWQSWTLSTMACVCFASVFQFYRHVPALESSPSGGSSLQRLGMWLAFAVATLLVTAFSGKIADLLDKREASLLQMREELSRSDRLASLVTLAAGAAHELGTPLATIAVVAKELERYATGTEPNPAIVLDCRLIRTEVDRCRDILQRMSIEGAEPTGEPLRSLPVETLLAQVLDTFSPRERVLIDLEPADSAIHVKIPRHAVEQALIALVRNALDASLPGGRIELRISRINDADRSSVRFTVRDYGSGMSPDALRRAGEPFYTTKPPGKGMGLGIFLARTLAERLEGRLSLESSHAGTTATFEIPLEYETSPAIA